MGALVLAGLLPGCSGSGGGGTAGVSVTKTTVDVAEYEYVVAATAFRDGSVALTDAGTVFRSSDGEDWDQVETAGLVSRRGSNTSYGGIAAGDGFLLVAGKRVAGSGDDAIWVPVIWRSEDGEQWDQLDPTGLTTDFPDFLIAHDDGFVLFGSEPIPTPPDYVPTDEEDEAGELPATIDVTSTWRSDDGEQWERVGGYVLPPGDNSFEGVSAAAAVGDRWLAAFGVECSGCYDDYALVLSGSDDAGETWTELDPRGLEDIQLANTDVIPRIVSFDSGFVAVGTSGAEDTEATLWRSDDGRGWTGKQRLGGPKVEEYAEDIDALVATATGVVALEIDGDRLVSWKVELG